MAAEAARDYSRPRARDLFRTRTDNARGPFEPLTLWTVENRCRKIFLYKTLHSAKAKSKRSTYGKRNGWNYEGESRDHHWWKSRARTQHCSESCRAGRQCHFYLSLESERGQLTHPRSRSDGKESSGISARYRRHSHVRRIRGGCPQNAARLGARSVRLSGEQCRWFAPCKFRANHGSGIRR